MSEVQQPTIEEIGQSVQDVPEEEPGSARFEVGLTPLGRPAVNISDGSGNVASYTFSAPDELSGAIGHLTALLVMMIQGLYQQKIAETQAAQSLLANAQGGGLWTPPN